MGVKTTVPFTLTEGGTVSLPIVAITSTVAKPKNQRWKKLEFLRLVWEA